MYCRCLRDASGVHRVIHDIDPVLGPIKDEIITHAIISDKYRVALKLDTGAKCNVMPRRVFNHVATPAPDTHIDTSCNATLVAFGGDKIQSIWKLQDKMQNWSAGEICRISDS